MTKNTLSSIILILSIFVVASSCTSNANSQEWKMKQARIMTPWSETIDVNNVLGEYPRPQMERNYWYNLNGVWDFTNTKSTNPDITYNPNLTFDKKILVPFPMESAISGIMDTNHNENKGKVIAYRRTFTLTDEMKGKNLLLHFEIGRAHV